MRFLFLFIMILLLNISCLYSKTLFFEINDLTDNKTEKISFNTNKTNKLKFKETNFEVNITPKLKNKYHAFKAEIKNLNSNEEKAVIATVICPTEGSDFTWYYDVCASTLCETGKTYFEQDYNLHLELYYFVLI